MNVERNEIPMKSGNFEFITYRQKTGYSGKSIKSHDYHIGKFTNWCNKNKINYKSISFEDILKYIREEKARGVKEAAINNSLNAISIYYDWLVKTEQVKQNITRQIRVKSTHKKAIAEPMKPTELEKLYNDFSNLPSWSFKTKKENILHKRNLVIFGLMNYQGLTTGELSKLETKHINLKEGKIYVPSTRKSNSRILKLQANQILPLQNYLNEIRQKIINEPTEKLFPAKKFTDLVSRIIKQAKQLCSQLQNSRQIRQSVIMNWLKTNNIRQVQYMAGHKKIRSTEQYRSHDLTDLTKQLELFHPLK